MTETDWPALIADHGPAVWRTVFRLLGRHADAHDCYQEVFLDAYRAAQGRAIDRWPAFLKSLATRRAIDHLRRRGRSARRLAPLDPAAEPAATGFSAAEMAEGAESLDGLRALLAGLPARQAEAFWLIGVEEMPHAEASAAMEVSPGELRVLLHRARARLRAAYSEPPRTRSDR
ncbi:RNA polymerase sigma factor [Tundrisphaera sp. TA3]|uniref:RNA polymerase sigma factor n=1 Tax=Tundrisphaera sp. TA3 TaxID=3435775 RepID=UPI003EB7CE66